MFDKLKQLKELRDRAKQIQEALSEITVTERSGDGKLFVTIDGNMNISDLGIDNLERTHELKDVLNRAIKEAQKKSAEYMRSSGAFNLPGLS